jgi:hypothetical protein
MKRKAFILFCLFALTATACKHSQRPADVLDASTMADFLSELYLVEGYYAVKSNYRFDSASPEVLAACDDILKKNHLSRETVEKSFDYYSQHPEEYEAIQKEVASRIEKLNATNAAVPQE